MTDRRFLNPAWPLVACCTVAMLWPASDVWNGYAGANVAGRHLSIDVGPGWLAFTSGQPRSPAAAVRAWRMTASDRKERANPRVYRSNGDYRFWCPLWLVAASSGLFGAGLLGSRIRHSTRSRPGHCRRCGYDLRASPGRCPECGLATPGVGSR